MQISLGGCRIHFSEHDGDARQGGPRHFRFDRRLHHHRAWRSLARMTVPTDQDCHNAAIRAAIAARQAAEIDSKHHRTAAIRLA